MRQALPILFCLWEKVDGAPAGMKHPHPNIAYRPDIDGLRAVAVASVVLFHAGVPYVAGGYVGVDIFFVISGYLITSIILKDLDAGCFSFLGFYERRIRRILPAFSVVALVTTFAALAILPPFELERFGKALVASLLFASNFWFWDQSGYFAEPAEQEFLLHTWTLSVEEQFYVLWPLCLWLLARPPLRRARPYVLPAMVVLSLAISQYLASAHPAAGFYLIHSRFWELGLGALLAFSRDRIPASDLVANTYGALGLALIAFAVFAFGPDTTFPGFNALVPCLGAALLIHSGARSTAAARLLSLRPVVFLGLISYSLYLWHWPVLTLSKFYLARDLGTGEAAVALAVTMALSSLSWRYVELPFRRRTGAARRPLRALMGGAATIVAFVAVGAFTIDTHGLPSRAPPELVAMQDAARIHRPVGDACWPEGSDLPAAELCTIGASGAPTVIVWGDSHADPWAAALAKQAEGRGFAMRQITKASCAPLAGAVRYERDKLDTDCRDFNRAALSEILAMPDVAAVVLVSRWSLYTETHPLRSSDRSIYLMDGDHSERTVDSSRRALEASLRRTVASLGEHGIRTVIVSQAPEFLTDIPPCVISARWRGGPEEHCFISAERSGQRLGASIALIRRIDQDAEKAAALFPDSYICDAVLCRGAISDSLLYRDEHHLSVQGAERSLPDLLDLIFPADETSKLRAEREASPESARIAGEESGHSAQ